MLNFARSLVAYIDIMGTKSLMKDSEQKLKLLELLVEFQQVVSRGSFNQSSDGKYEVKPTVSTFSDHLVISMPIKSDEQEGVICFGALGIMSALLTHLFRRVLSGGFLLRGAISTIKAP